MAVKNLPWVSSLLLSLTGGERTRVLIAIGIHRRNNGNQTQGEASAMEQEGRGGRNLGMWHHHISESANPGAHPTAGRLLWKRICLLLA